MAVTIREVEHIAQLAKLDFTMEEKEKLVSDLNRILEHIDKLNELDTTHVEPLSQIVATHNVLRNDAIEPSLPRTDALRNAPDSTEEFFRVPKVIDGQ